LIKVGLVDKATIDHRLRDRLPVQLYFAHDVLCLRRLQYPLFDEKFGKLFMRHVSRLQSSAPVSGAGEHVFAIANFSLEPCLFSAAGTQREDCFGVTPKPTRETRALPN
jgi:hypothetical protein